MTLELPDETRNVMVSAIAALIDNGSGPGRIELMTSDRRVLAVLKCSKPSAARTVAGELTFAPIMEDPNARGTGKAVKASIVDGDGQEVFACDVSDLKGDGVIKLNTNQIVAGGPVRIRSFTLTMPSSSS